MTAKDLQTVAASLAVIEQRFRTTANRMLPDSLSISDRELFELHVREGMELLTESGHIELVKRVQKHMAPGPAGWPWPSKELVGVVRSLFQAAADQILRRDARGVAGRQSEYVATSRITELRSLPRSSWDLSRLVRMLEELNEVNARGLTMASAMLVRAITDHVPPIFSQPNFAAVANNYSSGPSGGKSFRNSMNRLDGSLRNIADSVLHVQVRASEVLPTALQVDFRQDLDVLLGEIVRLVRP